MNVLNEVVRGAASQFGREFGRAGANAVLKGGNYYTIQSSDYSGRIKPSDSDLVRAIKEINKIKFQIDNATRIIKRNQQQIEFQPAPIKALRQFKFSTST